MAPETLAVQPNIADEIDVYRRRYNDATTWLAEVLDGSMRTPFEYQFDGLELYAEDGGALGNIFNKSIDDARQLTAHSPELAFELRRRNKEKDEYNDMLAMMRGEAPNTMVVVSDFPPELMDSTVDVGGYNAKRKTTMLRVLVRQGARLKMYSQTLDLSDREALTAIYGYFGRQPETGELLGQRLQLDLNEADQNSLTDRLMNTYDQNLQQRHGGYWRAGRQEASHSDTYTFALSQRDIIDHCVQRNLLGQMNQAELYDVAALLAERFEAAKTPHVAYDLEPEQIISGYMKTGWLEQQLQMAGNAARAAGKVFSGCGASIGGQSAEGQLAEAGYGNQSENQDGDEDEYGSLTFKCKNGHTNRRPRGKLISQCRVASCKNSVAC